MTALPATPFVNYNIFISQQQDDNLSELGFGIFFFRKNLLNPSSVIYQGSQKIPI